MKKVLCLFFALALSLPLCEVSMAENPDEIPGTAEFPYIGFRFTPPESYQDTTGIVAVEGPMDLSDVVHIVNWSYYAMTGEKYTEYMSSHELTIPAEELRGIILFSVIAVGRGMTFSQFNTYSGSLLPEERVREIGRAGDVIFYLYMEDPNPYFIEDVDPVYRDEYIALASAADDVAAAFAFFEPQEKPDPYAGLAGSRIEFTTTDLDGNPVSSADLFAQNDITVVNIWATWCGPCIGELEDLQGIHKRMQKEGVAVVGMLTDGDIDTARELLAEFSVTYPVILAPDTLNDFFALESLPSTLFIGSDGTVLADPVLGARPERYITILNALLR